ncbi:NAD(P)-dependent oxidoreductase [Actinokineospora iranica]|uniref:3-hydroxyisobutyrate dehydrogenase n=1 Tax=Actinokineospora iranica TaxID=1271860 RepID=A0A1G6S954_9PSEU|nr:NAD(P)-binding domain-containing protein [Actinokineospora iranica]SDD13194.1 3-hydroxyisobutyrate dehydrogenase [Actinokineospora iranica]
MSTLPPSESPVTVIGLGLMGQALAKAFLANGHPTTVWNRSAGKADELVGQGAVLAESVRAAVEAGPLVVVCVSDYDAVHGLLDPVGASLAGRTLVNLTTASSTQARETAQWAEKLGVAYLDGAILALPAAIGTSEATMLYAGSQAAFGEHEATLKALSEDVTVYLGEDHGLSALYDMAVLTIMWGVLNSFLHAAALLGTANVSAGAFAGMATTAINVTADYVTAYSEQIDAGEFPATDATVNVHLGGMRHLLEESEVLGVNIDLPKFFLQVANRAVVDGDAENSYAALIKQFRKRSA